MKTRIALAASLLMCSLGGEVAFGKTYRTESPVVGFDQLSTSQTIEVPLPALPESGAADDTCPDRERTDVARRARVTLSYTPPAGGHPPNELWSMELSVALGADSRKLSVGQFEARDVYSASTAFQEFERDSVSIAVTAASATSGSPAVPIQLNDLPAWVRGTPAALMLRVQIEAESFAEFDPTDVPKLKLDSAANLVLVENEDELTGVEEYELEWVFLSAQSGRAYGEDPFSLMDPVRVLMKGTTYPIDRHHGEGTLFYRVRGVGRHFEHSNCVRMSEAQAKASRRPGKWSSRLDVNVSSFGTQQVWQSKIGFREDGQQRQQMVYLDGELRSRQSLTYLSSENRTLVAETKYDLEGRGAVQILPAPAAPTQPKLAYRNTFNTFVGGQELTTSTAPALDQHDGAGKYYSSASSAEGTHGKFIPDAGGYPYSLVAQARDAVGRQMYAIGPGSGLRGPGAEHGAKFRYGTPTQTQLKRLFGSNAGEALNYERNTSVDPNGQAHIAYIDGGGRTIATSLAGPAPSPLDSIAPPSQGLWQDLSLLSDIDMEEGRSVATNTIAHETLSGLPTPYYFKYDLSGIRYRVTPEGFPTLCSSCRYQIAIDIVDPDGNHLQLQDLPPAQLGMPATTAPPCPINTGAPFQPYVKDLAEPNPPACVDGPDYNQATPFGGVAACVYFDVPGVYRVTKTLILVDGDIAADRPEETPGGEWVPGDSLPPDDDPPTTDCSATCETDCGTAVTLVRDGETIIGTEDLSADAVKACEDACAACASRDTVEQCLQLDASMQCDALELELQADVAPGGPLEGMSMHPETCHLKECRAYAPSATYDMGMALTTTHAEALARGYLDPLGMSGGYGSAGIPPGANGGTRDPWLARFLFIPSLLDNLTTALREDLADVRRVFGNFDPAGPVSIWQFVKRPEFSDGDSAANPNQEWALFRAFYQSLKLRRHVLWLETKRPPCLYRTESWANVPRPPIFDCADEAFGLAADLLAEHCTGYCANAAAEWLSQINLQCPTPVAPDKEAEVTTALTAYCNARCDLGNPLPQITQAALDSTDEHLATVQANVDPACLSDVATADPFTSERICRTMCCTGTEVTDCLRLLITRLEDLLPLTCGGQAAPLAGGNAPPERMRKCFPEYQSIQCAKGLELNGPHRSCLLTFVTAAGMAVDPTTLTWLGSVEYQAVGPISTGVSGAYTHAAVWAQVGGGGPIQLYLFSTCDLQATQASDMDCVYRSDLVCPVDNSSAHEPLVTEVDPAACFDAPLFDGSNVSWPDSAIGRSQCSDGATASSYDGLGMSSSGEGSARLPTAREVSEACAPCLPDLMHLIDTLTSGGSRVVNLAASRCFSVARIGTAFITLEQRTGGRCSVFLKSLSGTDIAPRDVLAVRNVSMASSPGPMLGPLLFTGIRLEVRVAGRGWVDALVYSDCALGGTCADAGACTTPEDSKVVVGETPTHESGKGPLLADSKGSGDRDGHPPPRTSDEKLPDCAKQDTVCGIAQRLTKCSREAIDVLRVLLRQPARAASLASCSPSDPLVAEARAMLTCFSEVEVHGTRVELGGANHKPCSSALYDERGRRPLRERVVRVLSPMRRVPLPPDRPTTWDGLTYTGYAVRVLYRTDGFMAWGQDERELYAYSSCPLEYEDDCTENVAGVNVPETPAPTVPTVECEEAAAREQAQHDQIREQEWQDETTTVRYQVRYEECFSSNLKEQMTYWSGNEHEYQYELFYYDQAGNLVQTVPADGVDQLPVGAPAGSEPQHRMTSRFKYNSLNGVIWQHNPDAGEKQVWYDAAGRPRFSQTGQQKADNLHAFVKYDGRGRPCESGLIAGLTATTLTEGLKDPSLPVAGTLGIRELKQTVYDTILNAPECAELKPDNLRGRVAAIRAETPVDVGEVLVSCYDYDPHGNVEGYMQVIPGLGEKVIRYEYDVLTGTISSSHYQSGADDAIHQKFEYDSDNRVRRVFSSRDGETWNRDAKYDYYAHGPLARMELGEQPVQGLDYTYTIQGWLKSINSDTQLTDRDPGKDGAVGGSGSPAPDVFALSLGYFPGDYVPVAATNPSHPVYARTPFAPSQLLGGACAGNSLEECGLYDGTITTSIVANAAFASHPAPLLGNAYRYDQLGRLRAAKAQVTNAMWTPVASTWAPPGIAASDAYDSLFEYDKNSNLRRIVRWGRKTSGTDPPAYLLDDLKLYIDESSSHLRSNRLLYATDAAGVTNDTTDLENQNPGNYGYDADGRLIADAAEHIGRVGWTASGKVERIERTDGPTRKWQFAYDALDNRLVKIAMRDPSDETTWGTEYSVRDPSGRLIATYVASYVESTAGLTSTIAPREWTLGGAKRIGTLVPDGASGEGGPAIEQRVSGARRYEVADPLGSVLAVLVDRLERVNLDADPEFEVVALVVEAHDFYPFGMEIGGRKLGATYRFGFAGFERDDDLKGAGNSYDSLTRLFDPRLGRWASPDATGNRDGLNLYAYVRANPLGYRDPLGQEGESILPLTDAGADAAMFYAELVVSGQREGGLRGFGKQAAGWTGGLFASLWTPETAANTAITLGTAGVGALAGAGALGAASRPVLVTLNVTGAYESGVNVGEAVNGDASGAHITDIVHTVATGESDAGRELGTGERVVRGVSGAAGLIAIGASASARPPPKGGSGGAAPRRWRVGDNVYAPTAKGTPPKWSTVRSRFWKNEAATKGAAQRYGAENIDRMKKGLAPQRYNPAKGGMESMDLSHEPIPAREGGTDFVPRWPSDHARVDPYRRPGY